MLSVLILTLSSGCAVISDPISDAAIPQLPFGELVRKAGAYQNQTVVVGGYVVSVENIDLQSQLLAVQAPLGVGQKPQSKDLSQGRLLLIYDGFIDPEVYTKDRQITVGGKILDSSATEKTELPFPYLKVQIEEIHLWPKLDPVSPDPFWYDECHPYFYGRWWYRHRDPWCW